MLWMGTPVHVLVNQITLEWDGNLIVAKWRVSKIWNSTKLWYRCVSTLNEDQLGNSNQAQMSFIFKIYLFSCFF